MIPREKETAAAEEGSEKWRRTVERSRRAVYTPPRGPRASFHIAMCGDVPGPSRGRGEPRKYSPR